MKLLLFFFLYLVFAFGVVGRMLHSLPRVGFIQRSRGSVRALGTDRGALRASVPLQLLTDQKCDE